MKKCKYCKSEIDDKAKICPNCRKSQENIIIKTLRITGGIFLIIIGLAVIAGLGNNTSNNQDKFKYEITKQGPDSANFAYYIEGTVTNQTNKNYSYVQIEFVCYDKDNSNLGTAMANMNNLGANEKWKFKAMGLFSNQKVDHCDFKEITSW